jgi:hypothetical protein
MWKRLIGLTPLLLVVGSTAWAVEEVLEAFDELPATLVRHDTDASLVEHQGSMALRVRFHKADWPNVMFMAPETTWDWSGVTALAVDVFNPEKEPVPVALRIDNAGADGINNCKTADALALPGQTTTLVARFNTAAGATRFWGMRGIPEAGPVATGNQLDPARITAFQVFLPRPDRPHTLILDNIRLLGSVEAMESVAFPFVDRFGQYMHAPWPGKLASEDELSTRAAEEARARAAAPTLPGRDSMGGWLDGPQLDATGWFRTEQIDGVWWLVTPEGRLFFSTGMDCVGTWERTFVEGRADWFEWLPAKDDPQFGRFYGHVDGVHSMAEPIGGKGDIFGFYPVNLVRKYGATWADDWRRTAYERLGHWGFNTLGSWAQHDVLQHSPLPFTVSLGSGRGGRSIEGARGYWGPMVDVYDPAFAASTEDALKRAVAPYRENPLCIGYFVDNEIAWETVRTGTLASPADQPCRIAFVEQLKSKYGDIATLNRAWGASAPDWDGLRNPSDWTDAAREDMDRFVLAFARSYFEIIRDSLRRHAPNHLYLGCRFATAPPQAVQACAEIADVVSYNLYYRKVPCEKFTGPQDLGKPILIGEFHFGALDRGMFHTGLVAAPTQEARAQYYQEYVRSVAACPAFVGCHWFQYVDEPITGRYFDGENYNIGFVDVTDTPYPELVQAAREVHGELYRLRAAAAGTSAD